MRQLLEGDDVLAVLPTGFGKNFIFQLFLKLSLTESERKNYGRSVLLQRFVEDQILEDEALGLTAPSLEKSQLQDISNGNFQLIFASAEQALDKEFLKVKTMQIAKTCELHKRVSAIIIGESHPVQTLSDKR